MLTSCQLDILLHQNTYLLEPFVTLSRNLILTVLSSYENAGNKSLPRQLDHEWNVASQSHSIMGVFIYLFERKPYKKQTKWGRTFLNLSSRNSGFYCKTFSVRNKRFLFCKVNRRNVLNTPQYCRAASISNSQFCSMPWLLGCFQSTQYCNTCHSYFHVQLQIQMTHTYFLPSMDV